MTKGSAYRPCASCNSDLKHFGFPKTSVSLSRQSGFPELSLINPPRFLHQQNARRAVPGLHARGPACIETPGRHVGEVERGGTRETQRAGYVAEFVLQGEHRLIIA